MIPKIASCVHAVRNGVQRAHILDGRVPHVLLLEIFTDSGIGTMVADRRLDGASMTHATPSRPSLDHCPIMPTYGPPR